MIRTGMGGSALPIAPGDTLELWVDDIRLGGVVDAAGFAGQMSTVRSRQRFCRHSASTLSRRDPNFRQLAEQPTFLTDNCGERELRRFISRSFCRAVSGGRFR